MNYRILFMPTAENMRSGYRLTATKQKYFCKSVNSTYKGYWFLFNFS